MQLPRTKRDIQNSSLTEGTGRAPLWCPFPAACGCSPRPVTGQADRGIPQPSSFDGKVMPRKRLEGRSSEKGDCWRTLSPTPAGSGKSARPVPAGRGTLTTGSVYAAPHQPAHKKRSTATSFTGKETGGCPPAPSYFIRHNAPPCRLSTQVRDFRQLIIICRM